MSFFWFLITSAAALAGLIWCVFLFFSQSGWSDFAKAYPAGKLPAGKHFMVTALFAGGPSYNRCVDVTIAIGGLHVGTPLPLHHSFFIPWSAVRSCSLEKHLVSSSVDVVIPSSSDVLILRFPQRAMAELQEHFPSPGGESPSVSREA